MTNRRMMSREILFCDDVYSLDPICFKLYVYMIMEADDDGFVGTVKQLLRGAGATRGDLLTLIHTGLVIEFKSGVCAIVHWQVHNLTNRPGYRPTKYLEERVQVDVDEQGIYWMK